MVDFIAKLSRQAEERGLLLLLCMCSIAVGGHGGLPVPTRMRGIEAGTCGLACDEGGGEGNYG